MSWGDGAFVHTEADERGRTFTAAVEAMQGAPTFVIECGVSPKSGLRRFSENLLREREEVFLLRINPDAESASANRSLTIAAGAETTLVRVFDTMRAFPENSHPTQIAKTSGSLIRYLLRGLLLRSICRRPYKQDCQCSAS